MSPGKCNHESYTNPQLIVGIFQNITHLEIRESGSTLEARKNWRSFKQLQTNGTYRAADWKPSSTICWQWVTTHRPSTWPQKSRSIPINSYRIISPNHAITQLSLYSISQLLLTPWNMTHSWQSTLLIPSGTDVHHISRAISLSLNLLKNASKLRQAKRHPSRKCPVADIVGLVHVKSLTPPEGIHLASYAYECTVFASRANLYKISNNSNPLEAITIWSINRNI